jgi:hypothetical protein
MLLGLIYASGVHGPEDDVKATNTLKAVHHFPAPAMPNTGPG